MLPLIAALGASYNKLDCSRKGFLRRDEDDHPTLAANTRA